MAAKSAVIERKRRNGAAKAKSMWRNIGINNVSNISVTSAHQAIIISNIMASAAGITINMALAAISLASAKEKSSKWRWHGESVWRINEIMAWQQYQRRSIGNQHIGNDNTRQCIMSCEAAKVAK